MRLSGMSKWHGDLLQVARSFDLCKHPNAWMHISKNVGYISLDSAIFREVDDYNRIMIEISNRWKTTIYIGFKRFVNWDDSIKGVIRCDNLIPSQSEMDRFKIVVENDPEETQ